MENVDNIIYGPELKFPIPECSLGKYLIGRMKSQPQKTVIQVDSETGVSETIGEILQKSLGLSEGLFNIGLREGDVVALMSKDRSELYAATLAITFAGGVAAPINPKVTIYELKHMFGTMQPKYVFSESETIEKVEEALR